MKNTYIYWRKRYTDFPFNKSWVKEIVKTTKGKMVELTDREGGKFPIIYLMADLEIVHLDQEGN